MHECVSVCARAGTGGGAQGMARGRRGVDSVLGVLCLNLPGSGPLKRVWPSLPLPAIVTAEDHRVCRHRHWPEGRDPAPGGHETGPYPSAHRLHGGTLRVLATCLSPRLDREGGPIPPGLVASAKWRYT